MGLRWAALGGPQGLGGLGRLLKYLEVPGDLGVALRKPWAGQGRLGGPGTALANTWEIPGQPYGSLGAP